MAKTASDAVGTRLGLVGAVLLGWAAVALLNAVDIALRPLHSKAAPRLAHHAIDLGHVVALALALSALTALWQRLAARYSGRRRFALALVGVSVVAIGAAQITLVHDFAGAIERWTDAVPSSASVRLVAALVALAIPASFVLGRVAAHYRVRGVGLALGLVLIAANRFILKNGYPGVHFTLAACGATLLAATACGAALGPASSGLRGLVARIAAAPGRRFVSGLARASGFGLAAAFALATVVIKPPSVVVVEMLERDTPVLLPWLLGMYAPAKVGDVTVPYALQSSFQTRQGRPDLQPASGRLLGAGPIVIFITIDALRLEVLEPKNRRVAPNLQEIKEHSVYFSQARSPGSDTRTSLASLFLGRPFSMLSWSGSRDRPTLEADAGPRFPELLQRGHVQTVTAVSAENLLVPRFGIVRGFDEQLDRSAELDRPRTEEVVDQAIERLRHQGSGPLFFYTHILDPHAPYHRYGAQVDTEYEAYLLEVSLADKHVGRLRRAVRELGLSDRTALIVGSDHGEGFGEHGVFHHNKTLYEVMVHVPLMVEMPGVKPRVVDQFVSLMDAAPTILDLFHVPTPGNWMADSLLPFLEGGRIDPNRVLFMDKQNESAMLFPDGLKVIRRGGVEELYDVRKDPTEADNLWDSMGDEARRRMGLMQAYTDVHFGANQSGKQGTRKSRKPR